AGVDLARLEVDRGDGFERVDVRLEAGVAQGGGSSGVELGAHVSGEVVAGGFEVTGDGVVPHERAELLSSVGVVGAEELGDAVEVDSAGLIEADGQRVGRCVGVVLTDGWGDDALT